MKKLVLAICLVIASTVKVFGQDQYILLKSDIDFFETYNINIDNIKFSDSLPNLRDFFSDKITNSGDDGAFGPDLESNTWQFEKVNIVGFKSIDVSDYSIRIKKIEILKLKTINSTLKNHYTIYYAYQDVYGRWYSQYSYINNGFH